MNLNPYQENKSERTVEQLQFRENRRALDWDRRIQKIGWLIWICVVIAALFGLLGPGLLSNAYRSNDSLGISYNRFDHVQAPARLRIDILQAATASEFIELNISREFWENTEIHRIQPE